jgi:flagellar protein FlaG
MEHGFPIHLLLLCSLFHTRLSHKEVLMSVAPQPNIRLTNSADYRDGYANSVQVRVSVWDFLLVFGRLHPLSAEEVEVQNFQGIYVSPQQAKALLAILQQNVAQYEKAFGEIKLEAALPQPTGPIH